MKAKIGSSVRYVNIDPPASFIEINANRFGLVNRLSQYRPPAPEDTDGLVQIVNILDPIHPDQSRDACTEMAALRKDGLLAEFLGKRPNALLRPLTDIQRQRLRRCPNIRRLIREVESAVTTMGLYVWGIKEDLARASTTDAGKDVTKFGLHFDAQFDSLADNRRPIWQFLLNLGTEPRQLFVAPLLVDDMIARLHGVGVLPDTAAQSVPVRDVLAVYLDTFDLPLEVAVIPSGCVAVFEGRFRAHNGAKLDFEALCSGQIEPSQERDLVVMLDPLSVGLQDTRCDARRSFLEDFGMAAQVKRT